MRFPIAKTFLALGTELIAVMYKGRIVETGDREQIFDHPEDRYTQALLSALPISDPSPRGTRRRIVMDEG